MSGGILLALMALLEPATGRRRRPYFVIYKHAVKLVAEGRSWWTLPDFRFDPTGSRRGHHAANQLMFLVSPSNPPGWCSGTRTAQAAEIAERHNYHAHRRDLQRLTYDAPARPSAHAPTARCCSADSARYA